MDEQILQPLIFLFKFLNLLRLSLKQQLFMVGYLLQFLDSLIKLVDCIAGLLPILNLLVQKCENPLYSLADTFFLLSSQDRKTHFLGKFLLYSNKTFIFVAEKLI